MNLNAFENISPSLKTYLIGSMEKPADKDCGASWRAEIAPELIKRNIFVFDPCKLEKHKTGMETKEINEKINAWLTSGWKTKFLEIMDKIWRGITVTINDTANSEPQVYHILGDRDYVLQSNFLILRYKEGDNWGGTKTEINIAHYIAHIPIYLVTKSPLSSINKSDLYHILMSGVKPGDYDHANPVFENFNQLLEHLEKIYNLKKKEENK